MLEKIKSVIFGHAVAYAFGVPVEFCSREELDENPVKDMKGYGTYCMPEGCWSDDTSMTLCALDVLADNVIDYDAVMQNFVLWYYKDEFTPTDKMFDAGNVCVEAIDNYFKRRKKPLECGPDSEFSNGNGSLMRILPFALYAEYANSDSRWLEMIHNASALTHVHERSKIGCGIYSIILRKLLCNPHKSAVADGLAEAAEYYRDYPGFHHYGRIFAADFDKTDRSEIKSTGYVVSTLEAAIWCLLTTENYSECVIKAANLGSDTDTVAAVTGGLAGALYGFESIPEDWLGKLKKIGFIDEMCQRAARNWSK